MSILRHICGGLATALLATQGSAHASSKELHVAARMLHFIDGLPAGDRVVGVVVDPSVPSTQAVADDIAEFLGAGKAYEKQTLKAQVVSPTDVANVDMVFIPEGLLAHHAAIGAVTKAQDIITITNDPVCVESRNCVMSVTVRGRTEILWSRGAAEETAVGLTGVLQSLVDERP